MKNKPKNVTKGFTLVELLVVIAIIALLATIILPGMGNIRTQAKVLKCSKNLTSLYSGLIQYESEYKTYPTGSNARGKAFWNILRDPNNPDAPLRKQNDFFVCPVTNNKPDVFPAISVSSYLGPSFDVSDALDETDFIGADQKVNHDPKNSGKPVNALTWGGRVIEVKPADPEWVEIEPGSDGLSE